MKKLKFEEAVERLEAIVSSLEKGNCALDDSLDLFEEGVALVKYCSEKLDSATQKVKILTSDGIKDFGKEEDASDD
ncbi:MAG: exodeoxyribonuclease VII small subunit [Clostridia bacterium]|nr:exodeoxyribonuclease VII small subunit [Clostridia bacterium]